MRPAVLFSAIVHIALLLLILVGLPFLPSEPLVVSEPVAVEVVDPSALSAASPAPVQPDPAPPTAQPQPEPEPPQEAPPPPPDAAVTPPPPPPEPVPEPPKPEPPQPEPPKPEPPKPPPPPEPEALPIKKMELPKVQEDKPVELEEPKPVPKVEPPKKPEPPKPEVKPEPPKKQEPPKKETPKKDAPTLDSILNSVDKLKDTPPSKTSATSTSASKGQPRDSSKAPSPQSTLSGQADHLSASDQDALRQQIGGCWNVPVGGKDVQNMVVNVRVYFDTGMHVSKVVFVDGNGTLSNPTYRSFVESTIRAFQQDKCSALNLPREKYGNAGSILFTFSPKDMF